MSCLFLLLKVIIYVTICYSLFFSVPFSSIFLFLIGN